MKIMRKVYREVMNAPTRPAIIRLRWPFARAPARISSLLKKPAVMIGKADNAAPPTRKQIYTSGIDLRRPPILKMFCSWWQAKITEPDERNNRALKNAWDIRWKMAASHA